MIEEEELSGADKLPLPVDDSSKSSNLYKSTVEGLCARPSASWALY